MFWGVLIGIVLVVVFLRACVEDFDRHVEAKRKKKENAEYEKRKRAEWEEREAERQRLLAIDAGRTPEQRRAIERARADNKHAERVKRRNIEKMIEERREADEEADRLYRVREQYGYYEIRRLAKDLEISLDAAATLYASKN